MSTNTSQSTVCRICGKPFEITAPAEAVNVAENPALKEKITDGSLFFANCPHCGNVNLVSFRLLYHDPDQNLMLWLIPEGSIAQEEKEKLEGAMTALWTSLKENLKDYTLRRVADPGSLIEKIRIFDFGLEDAAIEMCKYITKMEMSQEEKDPAKADALADAQLRFRSLEGADNELEFVFSLDGAMHSVKAGFSVYEDCRAILGRNPDMVPDGPFPQIDADWVSAHFR